MQSTRKSGNSSAWVNLLALAAFVCLTARAQAAEEASLKDAVRTVAQTAGRAVVSVATETTTVLPGRYGYSVPRQSPFLEDDLFQRFFDEFLGDIPERRLKNSGLGSGVIIDPRGYILTNEHVITNADTIKVTLPDGREFLARPTGSDPRTDLAVIKIEAKDLPVARLGDSDKLRIGDWVVAIGNPFGFVLDPEPTVTVGVVSALKRSIGRMVGRERDFTDLIQTDAAINPGNSGGPLVNLDGEVVGINVAIFSTSGGYQGIGFAVPVNHARRILDNLIEGKEIVYGWLGVSVQDLNDELAEYLGIAGARGVMVTGVVEAGPAQKAGIQREDIILSYGGESIQSAKDLLSAVSRTAVGETVSVDLIRNTARMTVKVVIAAFPEAYNSTGERLAITPAGRSPGKVWRGISVAQAFSLSDIDAQGALVVYVEPGSPADLAGIVPGDLILQVGKTDVSSTQDFEQATQSVKGRVMLRTERGFFIVKEAP